MFTRLQYWWARRCALNALCISLEQSPETWNLEDKTRAKQGDVEIWYYENPYSDGRLWDINLRVGTGEYVALKGKWAKRIKKALFNAREFITLKRTVTSLQQQIISGRGLPHLGG